MKGEDVTSGPGLSDLRAAVAIKGEITLGKIMRQRGRHEMQRRAQKESMGGGEEGRGWRETVSPRERRVYRGAGVGGA